VPPNRRDELLSDSKLRAGREPLERAGIDAAAYGGQVANLYRRDLRLTGDYDFLVRSFDGLRDALKASDFHIEIGEHESQDTWLIRAEKDGVGYDFCLAETAVQTAALDRAKDNGQLVTAEDIVILKLIAYRPDKDRPDLDNIAKSGVELDLEYIKDWCVAIDEYFSTTFRFRKFQETYLLARSQKLDQGGPGQHPKFGLS